MPLLVQWKENRTSTKQHFLKSFISANFYTMSFEFITCKTFLMCCLYLLYGTAHCNMNMYLPDKEVEDLFGAEGMELYYIRDGVINHNAVAFVAHVQEDKENLQFVWRATYQEISIFYDLSFQQSDHVADIQSIIEAPRSSINSSGKLPNTEESFNIQLRCTGEQTGKVTVSILFRFHITDDPNAEKRVELRRLKKCAKVENHDNDATKIGAGNNKNKTKTTGDTKLNGYENDNVPYDPINHSNSQSTGAFYIAISVVTFVIILIVIIVRIWHARACKRQRKAEVETCMMNHLDGGMHHHNQFLRPDLPNNATVQQSVSTSNPGWMNFTPIINDLGMDIVEIRTKLSSIAVPKSDVTLVEVLQEGTFSKIYQGVLEGDYPVLIKTVTEAASDEQTRLLLFESSLFRGLRHKNLLPIQNVVLDGPEPPMVLFPYTKGGNLKRYLRDIKFTDMNNCGTLSMSRRTFEQASTQDLVEMGIQVACGMAYLAKKRLVHKDLATRNCVIDSNLKVKISDNALARDLFPADYCCLGDNENRPVRWLAMESLVHKIYSTASDVWSFGVLLWELQSLAAMPYNDIDDFEMSVYLRDGFRLSQPINCPDHLYSIMAMCWHYSSDKRPTFRDLLHKLMEFNAELGEYV